MTSLLGTTGGGAGDLPYLEDPFPHFIRELLLHQQGEEQLHVARLEEEGEELLLGWGALQQAVDHLQSPTDLQDTSMVVHCPPNVPTGPQWLHL